MRRQCHSAIVVFTCSSGQLLLFEGDLDLRIKELNAFLRGGGRKQLFPSAKPKAAPQTQKFLLSVL